MKRTVSVLLYILIGCVCACADATYHEMYKFDPAPLLPFQNQRIISSGARYTGVTFNAYDTRMPSEYKECNAFGNTLELGSGGPRRGKIVGPDTPPGNESPIGEAWILMVMIIGYAIYIKNKQKSINKMKKYTKYGVIALMLMLGTVQAWGGAGWWNDGGVVLTFSVNGSNTTRTLNSGSQGGETSLGTVTTGITLKTFTANVWKDGSGNICSADMFYRVKDSGGTTVYDKTGSATAASWKSNSGNNQVWEKANINDDLLNGGLAPGTYTFECWFKATGNNSGSSGCGTEWWYSKNGDNYTYTFIVPSRSLTVAGAANGNTVSGNVSGITIGTAYTITATPTSGYAFSGWTATSGGSSITIANASSATTTVTFNNYSSSATVTASFVAEETHDVTVLYKYGSTTAKASTIETAVGVSTERTFEAPVIDGYNFYSWTFGSGLTMKSTNTTTNPCRFVTKSTGTYELTTNYDIAPVKLLYGNSTPLNSPSNSAMTYDATKKAYYIDVTTSYSPYYFRFDFNNGTQQYAGNWTSYPDVNAVTANGDKVTCDQEVKDWGNKSSLKFTGESGSSIRIWFSYKDKQAWITETTYNVTVASGGNGTVSPSNVSAGKNTSVAISATPNTHYIFENWSASTANITIADANSASTTIKATSTGTVTANFADKWNIKGYGGIMGDWNTWLGLPNTGTNTYGASFSLVKGTNYYFKVVDRSTNTSSTWYGNTNGSGAHTFSRNSNTYTLSSAGGEGDNLHINPDVTGDYTFSYNTSTKVLTITYPTSYTITYGGGDINGSDAAISVDPSFESGDYVLASTAVTFSKGSTKDGYNWKGWYPNANGTGVAWSTTDADWTSAASTRTGDISVYACYTYKTYDVTLIQTGKASGGSVTSVTATYNTAMPTIENTGTNLPKAQNGYKFVGYWDLADGKGTQYYDGNGNSTHVWDKTSAATLYAYYKKAEISIALDPAAVKPTTDGDTSYVVATPTLSPVPEGNVTVCWYLLQDNGNPVDPQPAFTPTGTNNAVQFMVPEISGVYKVRATVETGTNCGSGTLLNADTVNLVVAGDHLVTVRYMHGSYAIKSATQVSVGAMDSVSIEAPELTGYTFNCWKLGEGVFSNKAVNPTQDTVVGVNPLKVVATYESVLTACYTPKRMIYFNNTLGWNSVTVYFYKNDSYWNNTNGTGANQTYGFSDTPYSEGLHGAMTNIEGTTIWYFDCEEAGVNASYEDVVFTELDQHTYGYFAKTGDQKNKVIRRGDFSSAMPMYVPLAGVDPVEMNGKLADYYNEGYWMNYPENTGFWLNIYNGKAYEDGLIQSIPFEFTPEKTLPMSLTVELAGNRTYGFEIYRNDGSYYGNTMTMKINDSGDEGQTVQSFTYNAGKCGLLTSVAGDYTFKLDFGNNGGYKYLVGVHYPVAEGDYRIVYNDRAAWSYDAHSADWFIASRTIAKQDGAKDIVSFYVSKATGANASMKFQYADEIDANGVVTWVDVTSGTIDLDGISTSGVYNFHLTQSAGVISVEKTEKYAGEYYIRTDCAGSSKWDNYRVADHQMTYTEFSKNRSTNTFGELFTHYYAHWCPRRTNIKFIVANDYSSCLTDTLVADQTNFNNLSDDGGGWLKTDNNKDEAADIYSANIRFMYNDSTNKTSRAYVSAATNITRKFLVLVAGDDRLRDKDGNTIASTTYLEANATLLADDQNWIYEVIVKAVPSARVKLYAKYNNIDQFFRGQSGDFSNENTMELLGGDPSAAAQKMRILYDFKTNRLVTAWMPDDSSITGDMAINADVMITRTHQEAAQTITFTNDASKLSDVKTVYGAMKFNRWILNNRANPEDDNIDHCKDAKDLHDWHPLLDVADQKSIYERSLYFISFPFRVKLSEVFGFGHYWDEWYIEYYDGLNRAKNGYWIDSDPNWKFVTPEMLNSFYLEPNVGYILGLDLDFMKADNFDFWANHISSVELYFPSQSTIATIKSTAVTMPALGEEYRCTINRGTTEGDRRIKDSFWRCIGVPGYTNYSSTLSDGSSTITWKTDGSLPFLYEWNMTDNTLTPQATSNFHFKAMHAYLVQNGDEIHWSAVSAPSSIIRRERVETGEYEWRLTMDRNGVLEDQTYIRIKNDEEVTAEFDFNQDMVKELNYNRSDIYTMIGYERVAANSIPTSEQMTVIPVGVDIEFDGEYTFAIPEGTNGIGVTLVDSETGERTSLSALDYTVNLETGVYNDRFYLEISGIQETATGMETVNGDRSETSGSRKVIIDGVLYIVKDGEIFDLTGRKCY